MSERLGKNERRSSEEIVFAQHEVGGEIVCGPVVEQRGARGPELVEEIAELGPLLRIEGQSRHGGGSVPTKWGDGVVRAA
jgi:hypothetical protein